MLVKHNLYKGIKKLIINPSSKADNFEIEFYEDLGCEEGKEYTLSFYAKQTNNGSGKFSILRQDSDMRIIDSAILSVGERQAIKLNYDPNGEMLFVIYPDIKDKCANIGLTLFNFKLEEGDGVTLYIPHIKNLPIDKKSLFPPEGDYKEIQPR